LTAVTGPEQFPAPTAVVVVDETLPEAVAVASTEARLAATVRVLTVLAGLAVAVTVAYVPPASRRAAAPRAELIATVFRFTAGM
jgi:hypothetical protein